ncbi:MAG: hypothetical protein ACYTGN_16345 [Planctomycetota bacterium]
MRIRVFLLLAFLPVAVGDEKGAFEKVGVVRHAPADEISGLVKSRTYKNVWWVHNDSGDEARLFAIDAKGDQVIPGWLRGRYRTEKPDKLKETWPGYKVHLAANIDWEDLALADGRLYICAMGNNGNSRRDLGVYVLNEPYPGGAPATRPLWFLPIRYPDQKAYPAKKWHFDCECLFVSEGKLYFLTKHRVTGQVNQSQPGSKLYRLDSQHVNEENVLTLIEASNNLVMPTSADLSPDGTKLAVLTVRAIWVFDKPAEGDKWLSGGKARWLVLPREHTKQAEAVAWDDDATLRIANEQRDLFRVKLGALKPAPR